MTHTYLCPKCGNNTLNVATVKLASMRFDPDNGDHNVISDDGDNIWDDESAVTCSRCGHAGTMAEFKQPADIGNMSNEDLANLLTDGVQADVWTDAPECHQRIGVIQDAMAEATHRLTQLRQ